MSRARILADYVGGGTTAEEFDHLDGVTSNIQTQIDAKAPIASPTFTGNFTSVGIDDNADSTAITIDSSENVGIGITPTSKLNVFGTSTAPSTTTASDAIIDIKGSSTAHLLMGLDNATPWGAWINTDSTSQPLVLQGAGGKVAVGTDSPSSNLHIYGNSGSGGYACIIHNNTNTNGYHALMTNLNSNQHNTSNQHIRFHTGGVANYYIYGNGTHSLASDERLKKNIETTRDGYLEDLCKFRVVKYNWFNDDDTTPKDLGLIAQEVEQIFPNLVQDDQATISDDDDTLYKQLKITVLPFMLLKAIQELSAKNDALEAENTAMKTRMDALEARLTALEGE